MHESGYGSCVIALFARMQHHASKVWMGNHTVTFSLIIDIHLNTSYWYHGGLLNTILAAPDLTKAKQPPYGCTSPFACWPSQINGARGPSEVRTPVVLVDWVLLVDVDFEEPVMGVAFVVFVPA